jgi:hypothetical protein
VAQACLFKLEKEEESVLAAPRINGWSTFPKARQIKRAADVEAITVLIETRICFTRDTCKCLQVIEGVQSLVTEELKSRAVKVVAS